MRRFSIRDLIWLILVVAVALGWGISHERLRRDAEQTEAARQKAERQLIGCAEYLRGARSERDVYRNRALRAEAGLGAPRKLLP